MQMLSWQTDTSSINSHSWTTECMGPTPPRIPGSWFFLMSESHSVTAYWITLSTPRRPCLQQSLFSFNSEQFNWARPIRIPANVPCETKSRTGGVWKYSQPYFLIKYTEILQISLFCTFGQAEWWTSCDCSPVQWPHVCHDSPAR